MRLSVKAAGGEGVQGALQCCSLSYMVIVGLSEGILVRRIFHEPVLQKKVRVPFYHLLPNPTSNHHGLLAQYGPGLTVPLAIGEDLLGSMSFEELWPEYEAKMKAGGKESASDAAINAFKYNFKVPPGKG